jgi:dTDP-4-amino-4,6-dideoxygalactose transaminase
MTRERRAPRNTFLPFSPPVIGEEAIAEVVDTLRSDWITTGPKVKAFEEKFAARVSAPAALAVNSCTDALKVALAACGIGPGDAVFTTTMTFCSTVHVVEQLGAHPVLVDIEADTLNLDPEALRKNVAAVAAEGHYSPRAIIPVHYGGHPCDMDAILDVARQHGLAVIEDAAHAFPATYRGEPVGTPGDGSVVRAAAFSFYATKNMTTAEGGMLTGSLEFLEEARLWSLHGMSRDSWTRYGKGGDWFYDVLRPGFKCNMTDLQAAIGLHQLENIDRFQAHRQVVVEQYSKGLADVPGLQLPVSRSGVGHAWHLYVVRLELARFSLDRAAFIEELGARNIGASVHFIPVHMHSYYRDRYRFEADDFPVAWREYERMVSLPLNARLTHNDADDVIDATRDILETHRV